MKMTAQIEKILSESENYDREEEKIIDSLVSNSVWFYMEIDKQIKTKKEIERLQKIKKIVETKETSFFDLFSGSKEQWNRRTKCFLFGEVSENDPILDEFQVKFIESKAGDYVFTSGLVTEPNTIIVVSQSSQIEIEYYETPNVISKKVFIDSHSFFKKISDYSSKTDHYTKLLKCAALSVLCNPPSPYYRNTHFLFIAAQYRNPQVLQYFLSLARRLEVNISGLFEHALRIAVIHRRIINVAAILKYRSIPAAQIYIGSGYDLEKMLGKDSDKAQSLITDYPLIDIVILLHEHNFLFPDNLQNLLTQVPADNPMLIRQTIAISLHACKLNHSLGDQKTGYKNVIRLANELFANHPQLAVRFYQNNFNLFRYADYQDIFSIANLAWIIRHSDSVDIAQQLLWKATWNYEEAKKQIKSPSQLAQSESAKELNVLLQHFYKQDLLGLAQVSPSLGLTDHQQQLFKERLQHLVQHWNELTTPNLLMAALNEVIGNTIKGGEQITDLILQYAVGGEIFTCQYRAFAQQFFKIGILSGGFKNQIVLRAHPMRSHIDYDSGYRMLFNLFSTISSTLVQSYWREFGAQESTKSLFFQFKQQMEVKSALSRDLTTAEVHSMLSSVISNADDFKTIFPSLKTNLTTLKQASDIVPYTIIDLDEKQSHSAHLQIQAAINFYLLLLYQDHHMIHYILVRSGGSWHLQPLLFSYNESGSLTWIDLNPKIEVQLFTRVKKLLDDPIQHAQQVVEEVAPAMQDELEQFNSVSKQNEMWSLETPGTEQAISNCWSVAGLFLTFGHLAWSKPYLPMVLLACQAAGSIQDITYLGKGHSKKSQPKYPELLSQLSFLKRVYCESDQVFGTLTPTN